MNARALSTDVLLGAAPIALLIALWQGIVSFGYAPPSLLPPPGLVFVRLAQQLVSGGFLHEIGATLFRLFAGFSIAVMLGAGLGLAAAVNPAVNAVVRPVVRVLAPVPKVALYPALLLLLGFDHASKITLVAADALFPILLSTYYGASMVEQKLIWSAMAAGTLHRGVSGRDDHLDRWARPSSGGGGANFPDRGHVRAADHHLAAGIDPQRPLTWPAVVSAARLSGGVSANLRRRRAVVRHCEERSDEAIQRRKVSYWIASLRSQ